MEVLAFVALAALAFWPIYELGIHGHGIGLIALVVISIALYALHLRRIYRNAGKS